MRTIFLLSTLIFAILTTSFPARSQTYEILHEFNYGFEQGAFPYTQSLVMNGGRFYGLLSEGGLYDCGVLFSMLPDGSDYTVHYNFHPTRGVGAFPYSTPIISGGRVYGACNDGGENIAGTVFSMNLDGSDAQVLHNFDPDVGDGEYPTGDLLLIAGTLYGVTEEGGANDDGTIFSINLDGSSYNILHEFGNGTDGSYPYPGLIEYDGALYGVCYQGGLALKGILFTIEPDGSNYDNLHNFGIGNDGSYPEGKLFEYDGVLYGTTYYGGTNDDGIIFSYEVSIDDYNALHDFTGNPTDGENPTGPLMISDGRIYGMTPSGGTEGVGTIFGIDPDGGNYFVMRSLGASTSDPANPYGGFVEFGGVLYAMSAEGGSEDNTGSIFSYDPALDDLNVLHSFTASTLGDYSPTNSLTVYDGKLYGSAWLFSFFSQIPVNIIYSIDPDGSDYEVRTQFDYEDGISPEGDLYVYDDKLYGTCNGGGSFGPFGNGTLYSFDPATDAFSSLFDFPTGQVDFSYPITSPTPIGGLFYGLTYYDDPSESGYFYSIEPDGTGFNKINDFGGQQGGDAGGGDVIYYDGVILGTTLYGGDDGAGTIFLYDIDDDAYVTLYEFEGATDGSEPADIILDLDDRVIYGCAANGGENGDGSIFKYDLNDFSFETIFSFDRTVQNGWGIYQRLVLYDGRLYGIAYDYLSGGGGDDGPQENELRNGGDYDEGVFFSIKTDGTDYIEHHAFLDGNYADGYAPYCAPTRIGASFFGTTSSGGASDLGTVFKYAFEPPTVAASITDNNSDGDEPEITAEITSTGGISAKRRGVCWDYASNPDPDVNDNVSDENGTFSLGQFISNLNLPAGQAISIRAFAENSFGIGYSEVMTVYTLSEEPEGLPNLFITDEGDEGGIFLHFTAAEDLNNCKGHLIVINACVEPTGLPENRNLYEIGDALPGGSGTVAAVITSYNQVNFELFDEIIPDDYYRIVIYPFNWNGTDEETINYKTEGVRKAIGNTDLDVFYTLDGLTVPERIIRRFVADFFLIVSEYDPVLVEYDGNLRLQAVESITFKPGFKVEAGARLLAEIGGQRPCSEGDQLRKIAVPGLEPERFDAFVYPNPTRGDLTIVAQTPGEEPIEVNVIDALGEVRISKMFAGGTLDLDLDDLPSGAYFVTISSGAEFQTFKITVIK